MDQSIPVGPKDKVFSQFAKRNDGSLPPASQGDSVKAGKLSLDISAKDNGGCGTLAPKQDGF